MWDPASYLRFTEERSRPFHDLVAHIPARLPRTVVDLGCGPGHLTATLADRWPESRIAGIDSSPSMVDRARQQAGRVTFTVGDLHDWEPGPDVDVLLTNAVLQWVPGHQRLLTRWARELPPGAWLAAQVPANYDAPSHRTLWAVADQGPWRAELLPLLREAPVRDAVGYAELLAGAGCAVDAWETTYVHLLPAPADADHPVFTWLEGTALRPIRAALDDATWDRFRATLSARLVEHYPVRHGQVYFPFRRVFFVARTPTRVEENP
ncbi:trans-aconitate 2-methyltransferase [Micromonospora pallida]|uniref:Trans-aconitate 2-methyltransferase n=1 Tax=Micromonospora pallida TaxID=145854 RepID=A0A1C6SN64_9ACTN|nr:trans-aconitate 2-methyltransferase [Micromonospora pallida]SCL31031.1 trans-aconitate 2-methyltransferase [Micromonospora pallida]